MENELMEVTQTGPREITLAHDPVKVLAEAKRAAQALMEVVNQKKKPVMMNGEKYLEFEDWQTVAKFYGVTVKIVEGSTKLIKIDDVVGYEATAQVIRADGMVISSAEAMCLNDEEKWSKRAKYDYVSGKRVKVGEVAVPLFQLRSMAQTRACAKALRNVLSWVVVLAGFNPTPIEDMNGDEVPPPPRQVQEPPKSAGTNERSAAQDLETADGWGEDMPPEETPRKSEPKPKVGSCEACGEGVTENVAKYSKNKMGRVLCFNCQKSN